MGRSVEVRLPGTGEEAKGEVLPFEPVTENWNEYELEDGTRVFIKVIITRVIRTDKKDEITGDPIYITTSQNVMRVEVPEN